MIVLGLSESTHSNSFHFSCDIYFPLRISPSAASADCEPQNYAEH